MNRVYGNPKEDENYYYIVMEFSNSGDLHKRIEK